MQVNKLVFSRQPVYVVFRWLFCALLLFFTIAVIFLIADSFSHSSIYKKDFLQEYIMGRAILMGMNPYTPLQTLINEILGPIPVFLHPSPHPPPVAILSIPFGLLHFRAAAVVWLLLEMISISIVVYWLVRYVFVRPDIRHFTGAAIMILLWSVVRFELTVGQLNSALLLLITGSWLFLRSKKDVYGGALLGLAIGFKLIFWPIMLYFLLSKRWKAFFSSGLAIASVNAIAGAIIGFDGVIRYYLSIGGDVSLQYISHERNFSIWTIGYRLFSGMFSEAAYSVKASPVINIPSIAPYVSTLLALLFLCIVLRFVYLHWNFDSAFGILVCSSILLSPLAWSHYLLLVLLPVGIVIKGIVNNLVPKSAYKWLIIIGFLLFTNIGIWAWYLILAGVDTSSLQPPQVPFLPSLLTLLPLLGVLGLTGVLHWGIRKPDSEQNPQQQYSQRRQ